MAELETYAEESITKGTMTVVDTAVQATSIAADCRFWDKISVWISNFGLRECYVRLMANSSESTEGGSPLGDWILIGNGAKHMVGLTEGYWTPYLYADVYAPRATSVNVIRLRIDVIKRRA